MVSLLVSLQVSSKQKRIEQHIGHRLREIRGCSAQGQAETQTARRGPQPKTSCCTIASLFLFGCLQMGETPFWGMSVFDPSLAKSGTFAGACRTSCEHLKSKSMAGNHRAFLGPIWWSKTASHTTSRRFTGDCASGGRPGRFGQICFLGWHTPLSTSGLSA